MKYSAVWPIDHGATAPSASVRSGSGTTSSGSTSLRMPRPVHSGQAPYGELNEKDRGSRSSTASGCPLGQASFSEKRCSRRPVLVVGALVGEFEHHDAVGQAQRGFHRVGEPLLGAGLDGEAVHHHLDVVLLLLLQLWRIGQRMHDAVDPDPAVALGVELVEEVGELTLAGAHHRGQYQKPGVLGHCQHLVDDLLGRLSGDPLATDRAMRRACTGVQQTKVVVHLGDGSDRRPRVAVGRFLIDGHRRRKALDEVDVRLVHLPEELACVGRQRLHVAPLALREDRVEGQRGLARSRQPGEDDQRVARQVEVDAAQVVLAGAFDDQAVSQRCPSQ